ncbi:YlzJ-like family protein [Alteribacter natronophilus]|uniref:YlzJ-like family protein n=1 Tax=Alteribacter natronophilus TaxID=2583810 RepID=UPI00110D2C02|nr:YlzJ-like family protein [Alteribacter natronophilus]TMW73264.1 ribonuclease [Alteribacter natronophilus]
MILYTYQSQDLIFPVDDSVWEQQQTMEVDGGSLIVEAVNQAGGGAPQFRVVRLISTDPNMYLDSRYQPGSMLSADSISRGME